MESKIESITWTDHFERIVAHLTRNPKGWMHCQLVYDTDDDGIVIAESEDLETGPLIEVLARTWQFDATCVEAEGLSPEEALEFLSPLCVNEPKIDFAELSINGVFANVVDGRLVIDTDD